jgi:hypothetical protein
MWSAAPTGKPHDPGPKDCVGEKRVTIFAGDKRKSGCAIDHARTTTEAKTLG